MRRPVALLVLLGLAAWPSSASYCSTQAEAACDSQPLCRAVSLYGQYFPGCAKPGCNIAYSGYKLHSCNITFASENWTTMTKAPSTAAGKQPPPHCNVTARPCPHESHLSYCPSNPDPHQCADQANHGAFPGYLRANQHQVNDTACGKSVPQPASGPDGIACKPQPMSCTPAVAEGVPGSQACNTTATGIYPKRFNNTGVFGLSSQESTPFKFKGQLYMMESVGCGGCVERNGGKDCGPEWDNITQMDPAFLNHSYVRVREIGSGRVVVNVPKSQGYGFFNAFVDYDFSKVWIFGTPNDRCQCGNSCGSPAHMNHTCGSEPSGICYGNAWVQTWSSTDLLTWETALAGGTKGVAVPNMDVARVRTTPEEQAALGLPPHRYIMILETAQSCCGQPEFKETVFMINNEASGDLTTGWMPTEFVITNQSHRSVGCPSIRVGTDGYYYAVTGMGAYTGIVRSRNLVNWTYGEGTFNNSFSTTEVCCGGMARPSLDDGKISPLNQWLTANQPDFFAPVFSPRNLSVWDHFASDADVCCDDAPDSKPSYMVWGACDQGIQYKDANGVVVSNSAGVNGGGGNVLVVYDGTLTEFLSSYFEV